MQNKNALSKIGIILVSCVLSLFFAYGKEKEEPTAEEIAQKQQKELYSKAERCISLVKIKMVRVEPGTFLMGKGTDNEHKVTITKPFWIAIAPIERSDWKTVMRKMPERDEDPDKERLYSKEDKKYWRAGKRFPVTCVSWKAAKEFCAKLNERFAAALPEGYIFDLPTEAQWEYAAQGGHKRTEYTDFAGGNDLDKVGWYVKNSNGRRQPVKGKKPNELGIYDMSGNVWEWCLDNFTFFLGRNEAIDPRGPDQDHDSDRKMKKGGDFGYYSYTSSENYCKITCRMSDNVDYENRNTGFRIVLTESPQKTKERAEARVEKKMDDLHVDSLVKGDIDDFIKSGMVKVEPGKFTLNRRSDENRDRGNEKNAEIVDAFWIAKTEVTQDQWQAIMRSNPSQFNEDGNFPVESITWYDAKDFCKKLNEKFGASLPEGYRFDLPTMIQWEYAAQGGQNLKEYTDYSGSNNCSEVACCGGYGKDRKICVVASKKANELGVYDMSGNVWEWCLPPDDDYYATRGGSWREAPYYCKISFQSQHELKKTYNDVGMRLVLVKYTKEQAEMEKRNEANRMVQYKIFQALSEGKIDMFVKLAMVKVEPGKLIRSYEKEDEDEDFASRTTTIKDAFWIGKTEVTQRQWQAIMGDNPSSTKNDDMPVTNVRWLDAMDFCNALNQKFKDQLPEGYCFGLPSEEQWEYAAQGGHKRVNYTRYSGDDNIDAVGWYGNNAKRRLQLVALKKPNELGLYDMTGNVWEWCCDFDKNFSQRYSYSYDASKYKTKRGGSINSPNSDCRNVTRLYDTKEYRDYNLGFRLVLKKK